MASYRGRDRHPLWYQNLVVAPEVTVQVLGDVFDCVAETVDDDDERSRLWQAMAGIWPDYDEYQASTSRRIPVVRLRPIR